MMDRAARAGIAALLAAACGLAACASRPSVRVESTQSVVRPATLGTGTIVSLRPLVLPARATGGAATASGSFAAGNDVRGNILGAIGGARIADVAERRVGRDGAVEFIVREDGGQAVSGVQTNELNFRFGERVVITRGDRTRLARAAPPPPSGT